MKENGDTVECDVAVLGGGLAGSTLASTLASKGLRVVCVEPRPDTRGRVGESLDWSSPQLLEELGFDPGRLVEEGFGTYKKHVRVLASGEPALELAPRPWFGRRPWRLELVTLHLDRQRFDEEVLEAARRAGVRFRWERVSRVDTDGERVVGVATASGLVRARRYVDASGRARLLGRAFSVPLDHHGLPKVTLWSYLANDGIGEGTTLTLDRGGYLRWIWEIPISAEVLSVGLTLPARELARVQRSGGAEALLREELEKHARFRGRLAEPLEVHTCSFQAYVHRRTCGPNWLMVGESAAMIDPLTSGGFTAALRFAAHAARLIEETLELPALPDAGRRLYDGCLRSMATAFNRHIERAAYEPELRASLGTRRTTRVYVIFGYFANAAYQKLRPRGFVSWRLLRLVLGLFELWFRAWSLAARFPAAGRTVRRTVRRTARRTARRTERGALRHAPRERRAAAPANALEVAAPALPARSSGAGAASPPLLASEGNHVPPRVPAR